MSTQPDALDYQEVMKKKLEAARTSAKVLPLDIQRITDAAATDPSVWDKFSIVRELRKALGEAELEASLLREEPLYNENLVAQFTPGFKAIQKVGIGVDIMATSIADTAALHARGMDNAPQLLHARKPTSIYVKAAVVLAVILGIAAAYNIAVYGNVASLATTNFYGVPTWMLIVLMSGLSLFVLWRHDKRQKQNPP